MTTPCSGPISLGDVQAEVPGVPIGLGDADVRAFTGISSGIISLADCYCLPQAVQELVATQSGAQVGSPTLGLYPVSGGFSIQYSGFSGTPEITMDAPIFDLGTVEGTFNATAGPLGIDFNFEVFPDTNLLPTYRVSFRLPIHASWPNAIAPTEQAFDMGYFYVEW